MGPPSHFFRVRTVRSFHTLFWAFPVHRRWRRSRHYSAHTSSRLIRIICICNLRALRLQSRLYLCSTHSPICGAAQPRCTPHHHRHPFPMVAHRLRTRLAVESTQRRTAASIMPDSRLSIMFSRHFYFENRLAAHPPPISRFMAAGHCVDQTHVDPPFPHIPPAPLQPDISGSFCGRRPPASSTLSPVFHLI